MIGLLRTKKKKGFTLIELLVVIAIIALLAALLTPAVTSALLRGQVTQVRNNGVNLYKLLFARDLDNPLGLQTVSGSQATWPKSTGSKVYTDSNRFFAEMVTNDVYGLSYNFFAAPGLVPAVNETEFLDGEKRNAWVIAQDVSASFKVSTPVLYTQNIDADGLDAFVGLNENELPFGTRAAVVVAYGGSGFDLSLETALPTNFNPTAAANPVLYPLNNEKGY